MAEIFFDWDAEPNPSLEKAIEEAYSKAALAINKTIDLTTDWDLSVGAIDEHRFTISLISHATNEEGDPVVLMHRNLDLKKRVFEHSLFEIDEAFQDSGIASPAMQATLDLSRDVNFKQVVVHANIDVGGYAWLRKGALPSNGITGVKDIAYAMSSRAAEGTPLYILRRDLNTALDKLSEKDARVYLLSPEFSRFKPLFLGSDWEGGFDITDPIVRTAMAEGAEAAYKQAMKKAGAKVGGTVNEQISDAFTRRQTYLLRYSKGLSNKAKEFLKENDAELDSKIYRAVKPLRGRSLIDKLAKKKLRDMENIVREVRMAAWESIDSEMVKELTEVARLEAVAGTAIIQGAMPVALAMTPVPANQLNAIVTSQPFEGKVLKDWIKGSAEADIARITNAVKISLVQGETLDQLNGRLFGSGALNGVTIRGAYDVEAISRTVVNGIQNEVKQSLYRENKDIFTTEYFVATLDSRTTLVCASNDGKSFRTGEGPMPPLHMGCRSLRIPFIDPKNWADRPFNPTTEKQLLEQYVTENNLGKVKDYASLPRGTKTGYTEWARKEKRRLIGQVPAKTSYSDWLKRQSNAFQDEVLGPTRAQLFREGKATLSKFVASDGSVLTLDQLRSKTRGKPAARKPLGRSLEPAEFSDRQGISYTPLKHATGNRKFTNLADANDYDFNAYKEVSRPIRNGSVTLRGSTVKSVKIENLKTFQSTIHTRSGNSTKAGAAVSVLDIRGTLYLQDGDHRVVNAWLKGDKTIEAEVFSYD